jgi:uncharacterized protein
VTHVQFNPVVERLPDRAEHGISLTFAKPGQVSQSRPILAMAPQSVGREEYGDFLIAIFNEWVRHDVGKVYVMNFEWALASFRACRRPCACSRKTAARR